MAFDSSTLPSRGAFTFGARPERRRSLFARLNIVGQIRSERIALADLSDDMLRDLGLTREEAMAEANRPVWDLPKERS
ncbi:MAG: DUF1127 domain-containing protein [Neomegalonema sp.]|nr:DUF1127 domain-containing protein [Neomegalonema sp.]